MKTPQPHPTDNAQAPFSYLTLYGYSDKVESARLENNIEKSEIGRVIACYKERYVVITENGECEAEITGNMRFSAKSRECFPVVGDWVSIKMFDNTFAVIYKILPRFTILKRQSVGDFGEVQPIAANVDIAFLVQAIDRDFSLNRLERYLTICKDSSVKPVILLTKADLTDSVTIGEHLQSIQSRIKNMTVVVLSNETLMGYQELQKNIEPGKTYCLLGSSGVGKSTLMNKLAGEGKMRTAPISSSTNKGKHTTSHRELKLMPNGGILIDNPGMREVGIGAASKGIEETFDEFGILSKHCRYNNCTHTTEAGCAVLEALNRGDIDKGAYTNYLKLIKEQAFFESSVADKRKKEKVFGKMLKNYKKDIAQRNQSF